MRAHVFERSSVTVRDLQDKYFLSAGFQTEIDRLALNSSYLDGRHGRKVSASDNQELKTISSSA